MKADKKGGELLHIEIFEIKLFKKRRWDEV
jgi:hypothetical protein